MYVYKYIGTYILVYNGIKEINTRNIILEKH